MIHKYPLKYDVMDPVTADRFLAQNYFNVSGVAAARAPNLSPDALLDFMKSVKEDCARYRPEDLTLRGDIAHGKEAQFENEARMALRLANFLSAFNQVLEGGGTPLAPGDASDACVSLSRSCPRTRSSPGCASWTNRSPRTR